MHEFSLASDIVEAAVQAGGGAHVVRVYVDIGPETHADPAFLAEAFAIAAAGTFAAGAVLELTPVETGGVAVTAVDVAD